MLESVSMGARRLGMASGLGAGVAMLGFILAGPASAQDPIGDKFTELGTDVTTYGALALGLIVLGVGVWLAAKYLVKAAGKA